MLYADPAAGDGRWNPYPPVCEASDITEGVGEGHGGTKCTSKGKVGEMAVSRPASSAIYSDEWETGTEEPDSDDARPLTLRACIPASRLSRAAE